MTRWRAVLAAGFTLGSVLLAGALGRTGLLQQLELRTYDARLRAVATGEGPPPAIAQVLIDDHSIRQLEPIVGRWPWPRMVHAVLVDFLARGPATLVVYDVLFSEEAKGTADIGGTTWTGRESDDALVESVAKAGNVILAAEASSEGLVDASQNVQVPLDGIPSLQDRWPISGFAERRPLLTPPFPALAKAARGIGHARFAYDADGPARRYVPFVDVGGRIVPSLPVAAMIAARGLRPEQVSASRAALTLGDTRVPWVEQVVPDYYGPSQTVWRGLVPFRGPTMRADRTPTFPSYSFQDVFLAEQQLLAGETPHLDPQLFKDRIVVVGVTAEGLKDIFTTPYGEGTMPGAEFHANVLDGLLSNRVIAPAAPWQRVAATLLPALAVSVVGALAAPWATAVAALAAAVAVTWYATRALGQGLWLPLVVPVLAALLAFVADLAWSYFVEGREKRRVKRLFSRYVSKDVYQQLLASPHDIGLGGERREMTVLFSDMRGFTTLSESGEAGGSGPAAESVLHPHGRGGVRPPRHGRQVRRRHDHGAVRGAARRSRPRRSRRADGAEMVEELQDLNRRWAVEGRAALDIGIGINTGEMIAGNIGSDTIMSYTVIGDNVNLGARLESLNKDYGTRILISEATRRQLKGHYDIRALGEVTVKGKTRPVAIFEVGAEAKKEASA